ncbi:MAG: DUF4358 domain-containing protein [Oscillospiraceae bacterium]|nr:DUF4358 domain-containing protein [Oscillospiraceae bacterium]
MKRLTALTLAALALLGLLTACGGEEETATPDVDLAAFYADVEEGYGWVDGYMVDIEGDMLDSYYPGLSDIETKQFVAKMPLMSSVVNELVFMQCETEDGAELAAGILQDRITIQSEGGAWYPESMEAWSRGIVIRQGTYVAMVASAEHQDEIAEGFNQKFL